eukprot:225572_1
MVSCCIMAHGEFKFQFTLKQFPWVPYIYRKLFEPFFTEKLRIENTIKLMQQNLTDNIDEIIVSILEYFINEILPVMKPSECDSYTFAVQLLTQQVNKLCNVKCKDLFSGLHVDADNSVEKKRSTINLEDMLDNDALKVQQTWLLLFPKLKNWIHDGAAVNNICSLIFFELALNVSQLRPISLILHIMPVYIADKKNTLKWNVLCRIGMQCIYYKEYQIALRILEKLMIINNQQTLKKWNSALCANCGCGERLKSCKGCMKSAYCSKKCQK